MTALKLFSIFCLLFLAGCLPVTKCPVILQTEEIANTDSLGFAIAAQADQVLDQWRYWFADSLEKRMNLTQNEIEEIRGLNSRVQRVNWFDNWRISKGRPSRFVNLSDSSFNTITHEVFHSANDLSAVVYERVFQRVSDDGRRVHAQDSYIATGFKFPNFGQYTAFVRNFENRYFKWKKRGNTRFYASQSSQGDDANNGTTWALAKGTLGGLDGEVSAGDTAVATGTYNEFLNIATTGSATAKVTWIDSLTEELIDAGTWDPAKPDTAKLWSAVIDAQDTRANAVEVNNDSFLTFIGFHFTGATAWNRANGNTAYGDKYQQCKFTNGANFASDFRIHRLDRANAVPDTIISCLFIGSSDTEMPLNVSASYQGNLKIWNNTFIGGYDSRMMDFDNSNESGTVDFQNNVVDTDNDIWIVVIFTESSVGTWDYNIYHQNVGSAPDFYVNGNENSFSLYQTKMNSVVSGAEANSDSTDPVLRGIATTGYWNDGAAADEFVSANNLGYGTDAGYWQDTEAAAPAAGRKRIFIGHLKPKPLIDEFQLSKWEALPVTPGIDWYNEWYKGTARVSLDMYDDIYWSINNGWLDNPRPLVWLTGPHELFPGFWWSAKFDRTMFEHFVVGFGLGLISWEASLAFSCTKEISDGIGSDTCIGRGKCKQGADILDFIGGVGGLIAAQWVLHRLAK